jgi:hypothetical protein
MTVLNMHFVLAAALSTGAGFVMIRFGVITGHLRARANRRRCSCCGRKLSLRGCDHCGT